MFCLKGCGGCTLALNIRARRLPDFTRENRPWCVIMNTDPKDQPGTHWLALSAPLVGRIELFDSFNFYTSIYSLNFLDFLHLLFSL